MSDQPTGDSGNGDQKKVAAGAKPKKGKPPPPRASTKVKNSSRRKKQSDGGGCARTIAIFTGLAALAGAAAIIVVIVPQRADLQFDGTGSNVLVPNRPIKFALTVHNYGQISARVTTLCARFANAGKLGPKPYFPPELCKPLTAVIPGEKARRIDVAIAAPSFIPKTPLVMPRTTTRAIAKGERPAILFGHFVYHDAYSWLFNPWGVFGPTQLNFCSRYVAGDDQYWASCNDPRYEN